MGSVNLTNSLATAGQVLNFAPAGTAIKVLSADLGRRRAIFANNTSTAVTVYLGPAGVTTATGFPLFQGQYIPDDGTDAEWYAITTGTAADLRILVF